MDRRLGRGLDTLLGGAQQEETPAAGTIPAKDIRPNPTQPRKTFDSARLEELRDSIQRHGILQPICVRRAVQGYEIVAGERRWRAARLAGLQEVPAVILDDVEDTAMVELALVENVQREDLDPIEKAKAFREMTDVIGWTQEQVAERVGMARATVANHIRLLELPREAQEAVINGLISMGHARALLGLGEEAAIKRVLAKVIRDEFSVRQVEELVRAGMGSGRKREVSGAAEGIQGGRVPAWVRELERQMRDRLGTRVSLQNRAGYRGQIVIQYHDREELDRLCAILAPKDTL